MKTLFLTLALIAAPTFGLAHGNDNGHENGSHDDAPAPTETIVETGFGGYYENYGAEQAAPIAGSDSGCHTGASAQGMTIGGSLGGASVACDAFNSLRAMHAAQETGHPVIAKLVKINFVVRSTMRPILSFVTLGLL